MQSRGPSSHDNSPLLHGRTTHISGTQTLLTDEYGSTYLRDSEIDSITERNKAEVEAQWLVQRIRGLVGFVAGCGSPTYLGLADRRSDGRLYQPVGTCLEISYRIRNDVDWTPWRPFVSRSSEETGLAWVFEILAGERLNWFDLYKLLDAIREDLQEGGLSATKAAEELGIDLTELERFKYSANCYEVLRASSRHATSGQWDAQRRKGRRWTPSDG